MSPGVQVLDFHLVSGFLPVFRRSQRTPLVKRRRQFLGANVSEMWMFCLLKNLKSITTWHVFSLKPWVVFLTTLTCLGMSCQSLFVPVPLKRL